MKITIPDPINLSEKHWQKIKSLGEVTTYDSLPQSEEETIERIKNAEIITTNWLDITENIIKNAPQLKYIIVPAVGYEWVDVKTAAKLNIKVSNCPTHNSHAVAEHTIGLIFAIARRTLEANTDLKQGLWNPLQYQGIELYGKNLLIIGQGNIGKRVAKLAESIGMITSHANSQTKPHDLDNSISQADFICLNLPLTPQSKHLIDARRIGLMRPNAYIINTARGAIIDQKALILALKENRIAGAALDVFESEPFKGTPSEEILELVNLKNVIATPHMAYNTKEADQRLGEEIITNLEHFIKGQPINTV